MVMIVEGQPATHHFIHDDSHAPPVDSSAVVVILQHLGGQILWGAAKGLGGAAKVDVFFAQAKVRDLNVAIVVQQKVLQFQVAVDDAWNKSVVK